MCGWWPRRFNGFTGAYGAMSDRTGHFSIATIRPGTYILLPERAGYLHVQSEGQHRSPEHHDQAGRTRDRLSTGDDAARADLGPGGGRGGRPGAGREGADRGGDARKYAGGHDAGSQSGNGRSRRVPPDGAPGKYYVQATVNASGSLVDRSGRRSDPTARARRSTQRRSIPRRCARIGARWWKRWRERKWAASRSGWRGSSRGYRSAGW